MVVRQWVRQQAQVLCLQPVALLHRLRYKYNHATKRILFS
jgi:hypothetical protein